MYAASPLLCAIQSFIDSQNKCTAAERLLHVLCIALCIAAAHLSLAHVEFTAAECALQVLCIALRTAVAHPSLDKSSFLRCAQHSCCSSVIAQLKCTTAECLLQILCICAVQFVVVQLQLKCTAAEQLLQVLCIARCIAAPRLSLHKSSLPQPGCALQVLCIVLLKLSLYKCKLECTAAEQLLGVLCIALCTAVAHLS